MKTKENILTEAENYFQLIGAKIYKIYEMKCNGEITEADYNLRFEVLKKKAEARGNRLGLHVQCGSEGTIYVNM